MEHLIHLTDEITIPNDLKAAAQKYEKFPGVLQVELTNHCNKSCPFCSFKDRYNQNKIPLGYMDWDIYKTIIDQCPTDMAISLSVYGESLLHPEFGRMAEYANSKGLYGFLVTNGILLEENKEELLALDEILISIVDTSVLDKIKIFMEYKKPRIKPLVKMKLYRNLPIPFQDNIPPVDEIVMVPGIRVPDSLNTGKMRESKEPCYHPVMFPAITWDGDFLICCVDIHRESRIGNVAKESIGDLWKTIVCLRNLQMKGIFTPPCDRCRRADDG